MASNIASLWNRSLRYNDGIKRIFFFQILINASIKFLTNYVNYYIKNAIFIVNRPLNVWTRWQIFLIFSILDILKFLTWEVKSNMPFFCSFLTADELNIVSLDYLVPSYS